MNIYIWYSKCFKWGGKVKMLSSNHVKVPSSGMGGLRYVYVKYLNNCVIFSCKLFVSKGNLIQFGIFSYILYRTLLLKEINLV